MSIEGANVLDKEVRDFKEDNVKEGQKRQRFSPTKQAKASPGKTTPSSLVQAGTTPAYVLPPLSPLIAQLSFYNEATQLSNALASATFQISQLSAALVEARNELARVREISIGQSTALTQALAKAEAELALARQDLAISQAQGKKAQEEAFKARNDESYWKTQFEKHNLFELTTDIDELFTNYYVPVITRTQTTTSVSYSPKSSPTKVSAKSSPTKPVVAPQRSPTKEGTTSPAKPHIKRNLFG